jgi:alkylation response protein AidB-like acyl-CoA dehydrogenase
MDFELTEDLILVQETARQFADEVLAPGAQAIDRAEEFPWGKYWPKLAELGFLGLLIPEEHGGSGLGNLALSVVLEELNRACASTGVTVSVHNSLVSAPVVKFGSPEQKAKYLPRLAAGELVGAFAMSEPNYGTDAASMETTAVLRGDRYVLNGRKAWITNGGSAGMVLVFASLDRKKGARGISAFLVEPSFQGFSVGKKEKKMGIRGSETVQLVFDDLEVPAENRLGAEGDGFKVAMDALDGGRVGIASQAIGIARACLEASVRYANEREQFGKTIGQFQPTQWKLADMAMEIDAARLLTRRAAWLRDQGKPHIPEASMAKLFASEAANRAATRAVQIHGGAGYCAEYPVERYFRDAKVTEIYEGTSEVHRILIARSLLA